MIDNSKHIENKIFTKDSGFYSNYCVMWTKIYIFTFPSSIVENFLKLVIVGIFKRVKESNDATREFLETLRHSVQSVEKFWRWNIVKSVKNPRDTSLRIIRLRNSSYIRRSSNDWFKRHLDVEYFFYLSVKVTAFSIVGFMGEQSYRVFSVESLDKISLKCFN